ncbi:hypothetical protein LQZ18_14285 [Lachnospiraceae bacterium ZAX-1]
MDILWIDVYLLPLDGFDELYQKIKSATDDLTNVKVELETTGHCYYNIFGYLITMKN